MEISSELRHPTKWYSTLVVAVIAIVFFTSLSISTVSLILLYRILSPPRSQMDLKASDFLGQPEDFVFSVPGGAQRSGWFFPGLKGAPTVILCHGYGSNRGELLTLATSLQDRQYNVFLFDFLGHGENGGYSTMGYREPGELRAAVDALARRGDVDRSRFALWGDNLGAYAALSVAEKDPVIRAVILESVYNQPVDFVRFQIERTGLDRIPFLEKATLYAFNWLHRHDPPLAPLSAGLVSLTGVYKLFLEPSDNPVLAHSTHEMYLRAPEPKQVVVLGEGNYAGMPDDAKRVYENRIMSFLLVNLPPTSQ
jgi:pimeloyl-ACP methyl ester carboxylesterase